jgi:hypothetical protein
MSEVFEGIVSFVSGKGWFFAENLANQSRVFIPQKNVENQRYLKVGDRVAFEVGPNPLSPDKEQAINVRYLGHVIARQTSGQTPQVGGRS